MPVCWILAVVVVVVVVPIVDCLLWLALEIPIAFKRVHAYDEKPVIRIFRIWKSKFLISSHLNATQTIMKIDLLTDSNKQPLMVQRSNQLG